VARGSGSEISNFEKKHSRLHCRSYSPGGNTSNGWGLRSPSADFLVNIVL